MTLVHRLWLKKGRRVQTQPPSHHTKCDSIVARQLCQLTLLQPIQSVRSSLMMRFNQALLPRPERCAYHQSPYSSWARSSQCSQCSSLHVACLSFSSSLFSSHDPRANLVYSCQGFHSVLHLSQPSQPFPTILSVLPVVHIPALARLIHNISPIISWWSMGSMVSTIRILQICNAVVVLKQRLAPFQHLHNFSLYEHS